MEQEAAQEHHETSFIQRSQAQSDFISMLAHELRAPLHTVNGFLSLVLEEQVGTLNARQQEFLGYAHVGVEQLITLVDDMVLLSRVDSGRFTLRCTTLSLPDVIAQVKSKAEPAARQAQVLLQHQVPESFPALWADADYLQQALLKLISHALRTMPPGGTISIAARQAGEMAEISITDTGGGVPLEDQPRIFERFYQSAHPSLAKLGNFGLGLPIARAMVEQHGGSIWLQSAPERGSTVACTMPLFDPQKHLASVPEESPTSADPPL